MNELPNPTPKNTENIDLWEGILEGDRKSLSKLFRKFYPAFLNYGLKLIPREDLVKDSIQELFFTIWKQRRRLSNVEHVRSYLYSSFRRTIFRQTEKKNVRDQRDRSYTKELFREILNKEQLIILQELKKQQKEHLEEAINALSNREREALFLKFEDGLSNQEIAQVMEVNKQSIYNYIHRAVVVLQDYFEDEHITIVA